MFRHINPIFSSSEASPAVIGFSKWLDPSRTKFRCWTKTDVKRFIDVLILPLLSIFPPVVVMAASTWQGLVLWTFKEWQQMRPGDGLRLVDACTEVC